MRERIPNNLIALAERCTSPLYVVGGSVRDYLLGFPPAKKPDWDICSPANEEEILSAAQAVGFAVRAVFKHTGTVKLQDGDGVEYEFTRFRSDKYVRGVHSPAEITFTDDVEIDARRRDFTANAVYYDVKADRFCDPLGGIADIQTKTLKTAREASRVFGEDGLRLMRLCRFSAQLGFFPDEACLAGAREHAALILDIVPERVFHELSLVLHADGLRGDSDAPYRGLCLLRDSGVLSHILPELALGDKLAQRPDFHNHDVLEHSFRCVRYSAPDIRFAALLHDVGKPFCYHRDGNVHAHDVEGERLSREILTRLKAPKKLIEETALLVLLHMRDLRGEMREGKVRRLLVEHFPLVEKLLALKQADYSACKDDLSPAPGVQRWRAILAEMEKEGAPRTVSELNVKGDELIKIGVPASQVGHALRELLFECALNGRLNEREKLLSLAEKYREN